MSISAVLDDLIDALEMQSDSLYAFLDRETGVVEEISEEFLSLAEAEPDEIDLLPDWQKEVAELAIRIQSTDRYLALPSQFDVHEWNIMNDFCHELKREDIRERLLGAIHGSHAFRRFKDQIASDNLWEEWNRYRRQTFAEILRDWCEENDITLTVRPERKAQSGGGSTRGHRAESCRTVENQSCPNKLTGRFGCVDFIGRGLRPDKVCRTQVG